MPNIRQRVTRGAVRGGSAAAVNVGLSYLVGGGFNPYATGILIGTSILDSLLSTDPPPPPPTRQQILFGKDTYKQWVFGYGPLPVRTQYGGSFRRNSLPDKWLAAIQTATNAGALTIAKGQLEDLQGWSICDLIVYLSHGNMNSGGIRGIFIDDQYISLTSNAFSDYTTPATPLLYPTGYPIGGNPVTDNYTGKLLLTPALSGALPTDTALNSIAMGTTYAAVRNGISWNNEWVNGIGDYNNTAWARISLVEPLLPGKTFWTDREFPSRISLLAEGIEVFDLSQYPNHRTAAKVWTDNAISIRYYVETEIIGTPEAEIDMASVLESYNYAEDIITYDFAKYREGRAAITNGQDSATYTGRLPRRGRRYAFNGIIGSDQPDIRKIRDRLDFAANGRTVPSGSGMAILAGHPRAATSVFFKDEDYVENPERVVQPDVDRSFNAIRVRYKSQMFGFAEREIIIRDQDAVDRDGREILRRGTLVIEDAPNDLAVHARTVAELIEHRNDRIISLVIVGIHNDVRIGDAVTVSSTALEVNEKKYYVANRELNFNEDTTKFLLRAESNAIADRFIPPELSPVALSVPDEIAQGPPGPPGERGISGAAGIAGEDGDGFEYVYQRTATSEAPALPANTRVYDWTAPTDNWTDGAMPVTMDLPYLWLAIRAVQGQPAVDSTPDSTFGNWIGPIQIAEFGKDGQYQEFIFRTTASNVRPPTPIAADADNLLDEDFPEDWSDNKDDPAIVSDENPFIWFSYRTKDQGTAFQRRWGTYSPPAILTIKEVAAQQFYIYWPRDVYAVEYAIFGNYTRTGLTTEGAAAFTGWRDVTGRPPPLPGHPFANNPTVPPIVRRLATEVTDQNTEIWAAADIFNVAMRYRVRQEDTGFGVFSVTAAPADSTPNTPFSWSVGSPDPTGLRVLDELKMPFEVWYCRREFNATTGTWGDLSEPSREGEADALGYVPPGYSDGQVLIGSGGRTAWGTVTQDGVEDLTEDLDAIKKRLDDLEAEATNVAPTLTASNITQTSFTLSWSGGSTGTGTYHLQEFVNNAWTSTIQDTDTSALTGTTLFPSGRTAGTTYMFRVRRGTGAWSETLSVTTLAGANVAPTPPTITASNITSAGFTLSWSGGSVTTGQWELQYFTSGAWTSQIRSSTITTTNITGRTAATAYRYRVRRGTGPWAETTVTTLAAAPTPQTPDTAPSLSVTTTRNSATATYSGGSITTGAWQVQYRESSVTAWTETTGEGTSSVTITGLSAGTSYDFRVRRGTGPWKQLDDIATQTAPTDTAPTISVTTTDTTATVTYSGGTGTPANTYRVQYRRSDITPIRAWTDITGEGATSATITGLRASSGYAFRVRRGSGDTAGPWASVTNIATKAPPPGAVQNLRAVTPQPDRIQWGWDAPLRQGATSYEYYLTTAATAPTASTTPTGTVQTVSVQTRGLTPATTYRLYVRAVNATGKSAWTGPATGTTLALNAPIYGGRPFFSNFRSVTGRATGTYNYRGTITWPHAFGTGITHWNYDFSLLAGVFPSSNTTASAVRTANINYDNVPINATLYVRIRARNAAGNSAYIFGSVTLTNGRATYPPGVHVESLTATSYTLRAAGGSGSGALQLQENVAGTWTARTITSSQHHATGKTANTTYRYRIRRGTGPWGEFTVTTTSA